MSLVLKGHFCGRLHDTKMERIQFVLISIVASLAVSSCQVKNDDIMPVATIHSIAEISGVYELTEATFSSPVKLADQADKDTDLLILMRQYGWHGTAAVDDKSLVNSNKVFVAEGVNSLSQINLYVPCPSSEVDLAETLCLISMDEFQFHYKVDAKGTISLDYPADFRVSDKSIALEDIDITYDSGVFRLEASTNYYDLSSSSYLGGKLRLVFRKIS